MEILRKFSKAAEERFGLETCECELFYRIELYLMGGGCCLTENSFVYLPCPGKYVLFYDFSVFIFEEYYVSKLPTNNSRILQR